MKKQKSRKPLRHKALLVHLFCQHMTEPAVVIPLQVFIYASCSSFSGRLNIPFMAFAEASCAE